MKKVSAATVTELTAAAACTALPSPVANGTRTPSVQDLISHLEKTNPRRAQEFAALAKQLPDGFALVPVLYTRVAQSKNAALESEYLFSVRERFLKFLAQAQKKALADLGVCAHGIARMARGLDPANEKGERYALSVDHIIERSGSGTLSDARALDPLRAEGTRESYPVNHFGNLILLPQDVHDYKNRVNSLQDIHTLQEGQSRWILMMTPVTTAQHHGYVCAPQSAEKKLGHLVVYHPSFHQQVGESATVSQNMSETMQVLATTTSAGAVLSMLEQLARLNRPAHAHRQRSKNAQEQRRNDDAYLRQPFTVADLGVAQPRAQQAANNNGAALPQDVPSAPHTLRAIFNAAVSHDRAAHRLVERDLRPHLKELSTLLTKAYARAESFAIRTPGHQHYNDFVQFFRGRNLRQLCLEASRYPLAESRELLDTYRRIDRAIQVRTADAPRPKTQKKTV